MPKRSPRILVVDDDELLRQFYARVFENMGFDTVCAQNGAEALQFLSSAADPFSLVLMDLLMPVKTGWEAITAIRQSPAWQDLPIIAVTGLAISDDELERLRGCCNDVFLKDQFEFSRLKETVIRLVGEGPR